MKFYKIIQLLSTVTSVAFISSYALAADIDEPQVIGHGAEEKELDGLADILFGGDFGFELRYRYQFIDEESFDLDATASTLRAC